MAAALQEGGHDNVTVVIVDVTDDGVIDQHRRYYLRRLATVGGLLVGLIAALFLAASLFVRNSWFVGINGDTVAIYHGVNASILGHDLYALSETSAVQVTDLPEATQANLRLGIIASSEREAQATVQSYQEQIETDKARAQQVADKSTAGTDTTPDSPAVPLADGASQGEPSQPTDDQASDEADEADTTQDSEELDEGGE